MNKSLFKVLFGFSLLLLISDHLSAQNKNQFLLGYTNSKSAGDDITIDLNGVELSWLHQIGNSNFSAGLGTGYLSSGKSIENGHIGNGIISSNLKNINLVPMMLKFNYSIQSGRFLTPYFGLNIATYYMTHEIYISPLLLDQSVRSNTFATKMKYWKYGLVPEFGVRSKAFKTINFYAGVEYNHLFADEDYLNLRYLSLKVGLLL
ncbi:hypothetical protein [Flammeovirga pacifica]|uniref:Outer membrane protein beta-barrel domain-containing protein n=1 Tax=Flammeovirga pacifica TaxID=915059 RepID=A0A1S1YVN0_FLAPC|nr:hypothetical protein [Flammeovirga pacifica]OHX65081.1 hypothetical protein NH26_01305 [Flammeovirga pacifica]